nr:helix-turn-helix domain-containing protein [Enterococcus sp. 9E7_DIV0242]OTP11545.1 hypothetical protein A5888_003644 [Enterococcus sp. 9E7_DIV0242]
MEDNRQINAPVKLDLQVDSQGSITLIVPFNFDRNAFKAMYYERSINFKLMIEILMGQFISIEDFAEKNFISIPSVYRKLPQLKEHLQVLQIDLDLKSEKKFRGSERQIRTFYYYLLNDVQNYLSIPNFLTVNGEKRYPTFTNLWLTITYFRLHAKNYITQRDEIDSIKTFPIAESDFLYSWNNIFEQLFHEFALEEELLANEKHCLYVIFNSIMGLFSDQQIISKVTIPDTIDQFETTIEKISFMWITHFIDFFQLTIDSSGFNYMYQVILNAHAVSFVFKGQVHWIRRMSDYNLVILENDALNKKIDVFFEEITAEPLFHSFSPKGFTATFSLGYTFFIHSFLTSFNQPVRIHIFSKLGYLATTYLQEKVTKFSMVPVTIVTDETQADLLISDTYTPYSIDLPTLYTQPLPQEDELSYIKAAIEKKYYEKMLKRIDHKSE